MFHQDDYGPEILAVMGSVLDRASRSIPQLANGNDEARQQCASTIIRLVDQGEQDAVRLFELTFHELTKAKYSPVPKHVRMAA
jgi:hypothetical protein